MVPFPSTMPAAARRVGAQRLAAWFQSTRPPFMVATLLPVAAGLALVVREVGAVNVPLALLTLVGALAMQIGTNLANDYYDYVQYTGDLPFQGGSGVLQEGKLTLADVYRGTWVTLGFTAAVGVYLGAVSSPLVWVLTAVGLFGAVFYSAPPIRFGYRGLAEVVCGLSMGPIIVLGVYLVQRGQPSVAALAVSLPLASFVALILYGESIGDIDEDRLTGKATVASRLGTHKAIGAMFVWIALTGSLMAGGAWAGLLPQLLWLELIPIGLALGLLHRLWRGGTDSGGINGGTDSPSTAGTTTAEGTAVTAATKAATAVPAPPLPRLGRLALGLYLSTGLLLVIGLATGF